MTIKTKEFASLLTAFIATAIIAAVMIVYGAQWWMTLTVSLSAYILIALATLLINRKYLERTEKSIDRLINIVSDLDTISKLENDMTRLNFENFDIVALAKEIADQNEIEAQRHAIKINVKYSDSLPSSFRVAADKHYVGQVLVNLIVNSIRYGRQGGGVTNVKFRDMLDKILIEVEDNGVGIGKEDINRVFERFYRVDKSRSREQGGTGLGLAIVKHIIEAHGERITVRSEKGVGTTFAFTLKKSTAAAD